jgi:hypothetical protein
MTNGLDQAIRTEDGEYHLTTYDEALEEADTNGWEVVLPRPTEVQIDIDNRDQYNLFDERYKNMSAYFCMKVVRDTPSKSGGRFKRHITVDMGMELSDAQRCAIQAVLGSDPIRELIGVMRMLLGMEHPTLFYELGAKGE